MTTANTLNAYTLNAYAWMQTRIYTLTAGLSSDEGGLETVEYIAMIFVALVLLMAVAAVLGDDEKIGKAFIDKAVELIGKIGSEG